MEATINAFAIVPIPGIWRRGIHASSTTKLTINVAKPTVQSVIKLIPSARVVQGLTPAPAAISSASPKPNKTNPNINTNILNIGGRMVNAFGDLQNK